MSNFVKIRPMGSRVVSYGRTDMTKLTAAFRNLANVLKKNKKGKFSQSRHEATLAEWNCSQSHCILPTTSWSSSFTPSEIL